MTRILQIYADFFEVLLENPSKTNQKSAKICKIRVIRVPIRSKLVFSRTQKKNYKKMTEK
jgi:hypothetical protein